MFMADQATRNPATGFHTGGVECWALGERWPRVGNPLRSGGSRFETDSGESIAERGVVGLNRSRGTRPGWRGYRNVTCFGGSLFGWERLGTRSAEWGTGSRRALTAQSQRGGRDGAGYRKG